MSGDSFAASTTKKSKSTRRKESSNPTKPPSLHTDLIPPPKLPTKLQADFRPLTMPMLRKTEMPACSSVRPAQIQSVSFTAGTFGSITTTQASTIRPHLSLNLSKKAGRRFFGICSCKCFFLIYCEDSTTAFNNLDQLLRQAASPNEISAFLSSLGSSEDPHKDKKCDYCCCDFLPDSNHSSSSSPLTSNHCVTCMSLPNPSTITCTFNPRNVEAKGRLKLKYNQRTVQQNLDPSKSSSSPPSSSSSVSTGNKSKGKPCDNNIDDLVRFIDGDEATSTEKTSKKKKKKKPNTKNSIVTEPFTIEENSTMEIQLEESSTVEPQIPPEKLDPKPVKIESTSENPLSPEEEVNWITISRKQSKHKPTSIPSLFAVPVVPPNNPKPKQSPTTTKKKPSKNQPIAQEKVITETVTNSKKQQTTTTAPLTRPPAKVKTEVPPSAWTTHESTPVASTSTLLATAPAFVPSASLLIPNQTNNLPSREQPTSSSSSSSLYWSRDGYLLPPGPVQRPSSAFSPAPGPRCIRRPSPEPPTTSFPTYSPLNYTLANPTSTWNETREKNSKESQWKYPYEEPQLTTTTSTIPDDFPLYDPFNSGAGLTIPPSLLLNNGLKGFVN